VKQYISYLFFLIILLILQLSIFSYFPFAGIKPDLLLVIVIVSSLLKGSKMGFAVGFTAGFLQDIFLGEMLGVYTITKLLIGGIAGLLNGQFFKDNFFLPPLFIFFLSLIQGTFVFLLSENLVFNVNFILFIKNIILPEALYNALIGFLFYYIFYKLGKSRGYIGR
jgi:rod shape-determining protein MreD